MAISQTQIVDYLLKKVGYGVAKTDTSTSKSPSNEANASPLLSPGSTIWQQDTLISGVTTLPTSNSSVVSVYRDSLSSTVKCVSLAGSVANETWTTGLTNWIPTQYGAGYQVQAFAASSGASSPQTTGVSLPQAGSGNNDSWYFDYQSGIINFADTNVPTAVAGNVVYIVGARYTGQTGITSFVSNIAFGNISVANIATFTGNILAGNVLAGNISTTSDIEIGGNLYANNNIIGNIQTSSISGNVGITGNLYVNGPILSVPSTTTNTNSAPPGAIRYNSTLGTVEFYNGSQWVQIINGISDQTINPDGVSTSYTLTQSAADAYGLLVSINGVVQQPNTSYLVSNGNIVFVEVPQTTDIIDIRYLSVSIEYGLTQLANFIGDIYLTGNIIPPSPGPYHLGNTTNYWNNIYANTVTTGNLTVNSNGFVQFGTYTSTTLKTFIGQLGWVASIIDSTPSNGMLAFWDSTNSRWSYVYNNSAV